MSMAKDAGIDIPEIRLFEHGELHHFLIKRFDRVNSERVHILLTILRMPTARHIQKIINSQ